MASDYSAARQEFVDRLNASVSLNIPWLQKKVNIGKKALNEDARTQGILHLYVPAGGTGDVEQLSNASGPISGALDRTSDFAAGKDNASYYKLDVYCRNAWEIFSHTTLEAMFQTGNIDKNILEGRKNHLVQNINKDLITRGWTRAGGACVASSTELGFVAMSKAISMLQTVKQDGSWTGYLAPLFKSKLTTESAKKNGGFDVPDDVLKSMYGRGSIGVYDGTDWVNEPFMPEMTPGALNTTDSASGITVKADVTTQGADVTTQGADEIVITGFSASGTVKKGTVFTVEGVYDVTTGGLAAPFLKVFVVQEDATAVADSTKYKYTLKVLPMYFNDDTKGYRPTVYNSDSKIPAEAQVKGLLEAGATYYVGYLKEDSAFNWTPFELPDVENYTNTTSSTEDITIQLVSGGELKTRKNAMRFDAPYFGDIVDTRACRLIYYKK